MIAKQDPQCAYNKVVNLCAAEFKNVGFRKRGSTLRCRVDGAWQLISFQKSRRSSRADVFFAVNVGLCIDKLWEFFGHDGPPKIEAAHWRRRLKPEGQEEWWKIYQDTNVEELATELTGIVRTSTLPLLEKLSSGANLAVYWSTGQSEGLTDAQRLMNLVALLSMTGEQGDYMAVREELASKAKSKPWEAAARSVLARAAQMQRD